MSNTCIISRLEYSNLYTMRKREDGKRKYNGWNSMKTLKEEE